MTSKKWDQNKHFMYNRNNDIFTTQNEVVIVESSTVLPLMALLISILDVITSPQRINRCATFSAIHSSGESSKWKRNIQNISHNYTGTSFVQELK